MFMIITGRQSSPLSVVQAVFGNLTRLNSEKGLSSLSEAASGTTLVSLSSCWSFLLGIIFTFLTLLLNPDPELPIELSGNFLTTLRYWEETQETKRRLDMSVRVFMFEGARLDGVRTLRRGQVCGV